MTDLGWGPKVLKPKLFHNDQGDLFIQISIRGATLTRPMPVFQTPDEAELHINKVVPDMAKELYRRRRNRKKRGKL